MSMENFIWLFQTLNSKYRAVSVARGLWHLSVEGKRGRNNLWKCFADATKWNKGNEMEKNCKYRILLVSFLSLNDNPLSLSRQVYRSQRVVSSMLTVEAHSPFMMWDKLTKEGRNLWLRIHLVLLQPVCLLESLVGNYRFFYNMQRHVFEQILLLYLGWLSSLLMFSYLFILVKCVHTEWKLFYYLKSKLLNISYISAHEGKINVSPRYKPHFKCILCFLRNWKIYLMRCIQLLLRHKKFNIWKNL